MQRHHLLPRQLLSEPGLVPPPCERAGCRQGGGGHAAHLLQPSLRRRLLDARWRPFALNRRQLVAPGLDFTELDAMADALWGACAQAECA